MPPALSPWSLLGRHALVTGSSGGLGFAIAAALAGAGATVILNGRDEQRLEAAVAALHPARSVHARIFDVADPAGVASAAAGLVRDFGAIDILVNNAGVYPRKKVDALTDADWALAMSVNVDGAFHLVRALLPAMKQRGGGAIVNVCSLSSDLGRPGNVAYAASKGALKTLTRALAVELAPHRIRVNGIVPGFVATPMNAAVIADPALNAWVCQRTPMGRWGEPHEIANAALFLASDAASFVTGHLLHVDGGFAASY